MKSELAVRAEQGTSLSFTDKELDLIRRQIAKGLTDEEFALFLQVCQSQGLDPFARHIYALRFYNSKTGREEMAIHISVDGRRLIAARTGEYQGQEGPYWCGEDGVWKEVWLENRPPAAAKVGVWRKGFRQPVWGVVTWAEFARFYQKENKRELMPSWKESPAHMLANAAERLALKKAFPQEISAADRQINALGALVLDEAESTSQEAGEILDAEVVSPAQESRPQEEPKPQAVGLISLDQWQHDILSAKTRRAVLTLQQRARKEFEEKRLSAANLDKIQDWCNARLKELPPSNDWTGS
jgi:phage recombination protein Bet